MAKRDALMDKARAHPGSLTFAEFERLLKAAGWLFVRQSGSHRVWRARSGAMVPIQPDGKQAKAYQVRQCLKLMEKDNG